VTRGVRFAPSPTGQFQIGNFRTAWVSWRIARDLGEPWIVRFEDIDQPRVVAGAMEKQLEEMRQLGLVADQVLIQSSFYARHRELFDRGVSEGRVYACFCSRKEVQEALARHASAPHAEPPLYSGHCRNLAAKPDGKHSALAWRFRMPDESGHHDFIIARTDSKGEEFVPAYNWACAIDDHDGGYALLARAWDLAHVAGQQRAIHSWISAASLPAIFHTSLVTQNDGKRLEKRTPGIALPELLRSGWTIEKMIANFQKSFSWDRSAYQPGALWGEARKTITLSELGF
jgi:glutamyl-tRNA synthetase